MVEPIIAVASTLLVLDFVSLGVTLMYFDVYLSLMSVLSIYLTSKVLISSLKEHTYQLKQQGLLQ